MTCIIGLEQDGIVYVGADSAAISEYEIRQSLISKVFKNNNIVIGYTTSFRMGQLLQFMSIPKHDTVNEKYMITKFIPAVRKLFKEGGYTRINNNQEEGGSFIVGIGNKLFEIDSDFQVQSYIDGITSVGCGKEYALGAMRALKNLEPEDRIKKSLEITAYYSVGVSAPFIILKTE